MEGVSIDMPHAEWRTERALRAAVRRIVPAAAFCVLLVAFARAAAAQPPIPELTQPVNDFAHVIDDGSAAELDHRIRALQQATGDVIVIATVRTFKPYGDINEYAVKMFQNHGRGIGAKGKDNGILIVVAVDDHQIRIEVGYSLEEFVPDGFAGDVIRESIRPAFKQGNYGAGLLAGTTRLIRQIAEKRGVTIPDIPRDEPVPASSGHTPIPFPVIIFVILAIIWLARRSRPGGGGRFWGGGGWSGWSSGVGPFGGGGFGGGFGGFGGGGGGGFGGFGGGSSGGGGASGSW